MRMVNFFLHSSKNLHNLSLLILRLTIGVLMAYHGYKKLIGFENYMTQFPDPLGLGISLSLSLVIFIELIGGIGVLLGLFTRFFAFGICITMMVAVFIVHSKDLFHMKELAIVYMLVSISILFSGGGKYSIDTIIRKKLLKQT